MKTFVKPKPMESFKQAFSGPMVMSGKNMVNTPSIVVRKNPQSDAPPVEIGRGRAVQVDHMKPKLKPPGTQGLKL